MKAPLFFVVPAIFAALAGDLTGSHVPDRPPPEDYARPRSYVNRIGMKFVWIPPGSFLMGSPTQEEDRRDNETQHRVRLFKGFYMGIYLVTQEQWQAVMPENPSHFKGETDLPVENVSWDDCQDFIAKLRARDHKPYRLPTEAEWEYACRAGSRTPFHCGATISTDQANYNGEFTYGTAKKGVNRQKTTPVGSFPANAFGLYDMHGNLWQWCQDRFGAYPHEDVADPQGPKNGNGRVLRGGSWNFAPDYCRSAYRFRQEGDSRLRIFGFRVCFCAG